MPHVPYSNSKPNHVVWAETMLPALTLTLGLQILRTLGPYLRYALFLRLEWGPLLTGLVIFALLAAAFSLVWLNCWVDLRRLLILISPALTATHVVIPHSMASDHLSVAATIGMPTTP